MWLGKYKQVLLYVTPFGLKISVDFGVDNKNAELFLEALRRKHSGNSDSLRDGD